MRKKLLFLFAIIACFGINTANAGSIETFEPGIMNKQNIEMIKDYNIDKKYIETTEQDIERENQKKKELEEQDKDVKKGDLTYNPKFVLKKVNFVGNKSISNRKLQKLAKDLIGKEIYLDDVMKLTVQVSRYYQGQGYITSYAYLDEQEIVDGVVTINIHESKVSKKEVSGNYWERESYLKNIVLSGTGLNYNTTFNSKTLQGAMKEVNNSAYMKGGVEITRDENEDTVVKLDVQDRLPISFDMAWDDFGRDYTGRQRWTAILGMDNLTGFGDKIYGGTILSKEATGAIAGYEIPIGKWGTKLGFDYSYSNSDLGGPYRELHVNGTSSDYILRLTHPLKNTATSEVKLQVAFDWLNSKTTIPSEVLSDYSLRVLRTSLWGIFDDKSGRNFASIGFDWGINGIGATKDTYDQQKAGFYKVTAALARIQRLPKDCLGIFRINGQYSPQLLYPTEQMFLGGAYSIRGYQPSELIGDYGVAGSIELRTPIPGIKALFPKKYEDDWARKVKFVLFYDWGYVKEHKNYYDFPTNFLHSVGFGTQINLTDAINIQIGVGFPLLKKLDENSGRLYFSINTELDKWLLKPKRREVQEL